MGKSKTRIRVKLPLPKKGGAVERRRVRPGRIKVEAGNKKQDNGESEKVISNLVDRDRRRKQDALLKHRRDKACAHQGRALGGVKVRDVVDDDDFSLVISEKIEVEVRLSAQATGHHVPVDDCITGDNSKPDD